MLFRSAGSFDVNSEGYLQNKSGKFLMGYPATADGSPGAIAAANAQPVNVTQIILSAKPTSNIRMSVNLPADVAAAADATSIDGLSQAPAGTTDPDDGADVVLSERDIGLGDHYAATITSGGTTRTYEALAQAGATIDAVGQQLSELIAADFEGATYTSASNRIFVPGIDGANLNVSANRGFRTPLTVFDSLGNAHQLDAVWSKVNAAGKWSLSFDSPHLDGIASARSISGNGPIDVEFSPSGALTADSPSSATLSITWEPSVSNAGTSSVAIDFGNATSYADRYEVATINQNGAGVEIGRAHV